MLLVKIDMPSKKAPRVTGGCEVLQERCTALRLEPPLPLLLIVDYWNNKPLLS